jgi:hypothetical protein
MRVLPADSVQASQRSWMMVFGEENKCEASGEPASQPPTMSGNFRAVPRSLKSARKGKKVRQDFSGRSAVSW